MRLPHLTLTLAPALCAALGCAQDVFTPEERLALDGMRLAALPASPTNAFADNPEAAQLGRQFFFDPRFSGPLAKDGVGPVGTREKVACVTCHDTQSGGADTRAQRITSLGSNWTTRNTPTVINAAYSRWMFWDGKADSMWSQALAAVEGKAAHNGSRVEVARTLYRHYRAAYERVFGPMPELDAVARFPADARPGMPAFDAMAPEDRQAVNRVFANFGKALEAYERRLVDHSSPFDRFLAGDETAMSAAAVRGAKLFVGRAACNECHSGPTLSDGKFHNHGIPQTGAGVPALDNGRSGGIAKVMVDEFNGMGAYSDAPEAALLGGLHATDDDLGAFRTPGLRNVARTGPYMHTGGVNSLWDVMAFYNDGGGTDRFVGKRAPASTVPLRLADQDIGDVVEFLRALDGDPLADDVAAAPVLP